MCISFDITDGFITSFDGKIKHLVLFDYGLLDKICDKIKYVISFKKQVLQIVLIIILEQLKLIQFLIINNYLPIIKILTFHNVIILLKSTFNNNENKYNYNIFLEKDFYECKSCKKYF